MSQFGRGGMRGTASLHRLRGGFRATTLPGVTNRNPLINGSSNSSDRESSFNVERIEDVGVALNAIMGACRTIQEQVRGLERRIGVLEVQEAKVSDAVKELNVMIRKQSQDSFTVKGSYLEAPLRAGMAKLYCESLLRSPPDSSIQAVVAEVLGGTDARHKFKVERSLKYCKAKLTDFRTEERRKVLGHRPYCFLPTKELASQLMRQMHAPGDVDEVQYTRHLAILRKFVRDCRDDNEVNYATFRQWIDTSEEITEEMWDQIMEEDEAFDYQLHGKGMTSEQLTAASGIDTSMCSDDIALGRCEEVTSDI